MQLSAYRKVAQLFTTLPRSALIGPAMNYAVTFSVCGGGRTARGKNARRLFVKIIMISPSNADVFPFTAGAAAAVDVF